ncbi:MAG: hypothetical protein NDI61_09200 [Bdellovibrionaceae bacterium]|nr:hypothetical protein [Pseudobdellovibrionaceae bacterium]
MHKIIRSSLFLICFLLIPAAHSAVTPISVGIVPPVQFPPSDFTITGARVSLMWGRHRDVYGLDVGALGNITEQSFVGIGVSGLVNYTAGTTTVTGLQAAGGANINLNKTNVYGLQIAGLVNSNKASSSVNGLQVALLANLSPFTTVRGAQVGLYNTAQKVYGFQIGLVNVAESLYGVQIGLVNFHHKGTFSVSPIINIGF